MIPINTSTTSTMRYGILILFSFFVGSLIAQSFGLPPVMPTKKPTPYYIWSEAPYKGKNMLGVLHAVGQDSFYVISKALFLKAEDGFRAVPNEINRNILQAYPLTRKTIKGTKKERAYNLSVLGAVLGAGIGMYDVAQSYRACRRNLFCNGFGRPERSFSDGQVVLLGLSAGAILGWTVGNIKFEIPLNRKPKTDRYTLFQE